MKPFVVAVLMLSLGGTAHAATASFSTDPPTLGANDISNLTGTTSTDGDSDGTNNVSMGDQYIAGNQPVMGQTFTTGLNSLGYQLTAVTLRHVTYKTYAEVYDMTYTIRITSPSGGTLSVLAAETAVVPESTPGNIPTGSGFEPGSGVYITFTFACPAVLSPNTTYGFDLGQGGAYPYWETDGTISNAYVGGTAYTSGANGMGNTVLTAGTGDRVFVVALTQLNTPTPPCLATPPKSVTLYAGRTAQFSAKATGSPTLVYQWQKNGANVLNGGNISGATTDSLTIANIAAGDAGPYTLVVTNSASSGNSVTSAPAILTVVAAPALGSYAHSLLTNNPVAYWRLDETTDPATNPPAYDYVGGFTGTYEIGSANGFSGIVGPRPSEFPGFESTNNAVQTTGLGNNTTPTWVSVPRLLLDTNTVTMTGWIYPNGAQADYCGLFVIGGGNAGFAYGGDFSVNAGQLIYWWGGETYTFVSGLVIPQNQWSFVAVVIEPTKATLYLGSGDALNTAVNSIPHQSEAFGANAQIGHQPGSAPDGRVFNGSIDEVAVFKRSLSFDEINSLYGVGLGMVQPVRPMILVQPVSQTLYAGRTARFSATVFGSSPLVYRWRKDGVNISDGGNISGALTDSLTIANVGTGDVGAYTLVVTNSSGAVTSAPPATLTLIAAPASGTYAYGVLTYNPVAYWRLDEIADPATNPPAYDYAGGLIGTYEIGSANGFNGIVGPRPSAFPGFASTNNAVQTTGLGDLTTPTWATIPALNLNTNTVTMTAWIYPNGAQADYAGLFVIGFGNAGFAYGGEFSMNAGQLIYWWGGETYTFVSGLVIPTDQWSFVAVVIEPTRATLYLGTNGALNVAVDSTPHSSETFGANGEIGHQPGSGPDNRVFSGSIDEVAVFNYAFTPTQVLNLYNAAFQPFVLLSIQRLGSNVVLTWPQGTLLEATNVTGPWITNNAASRYTNTPTGPSKFYKLRVQ